MRMLVLPLLLLAGCQKPPAASERPDAAATAPATPAPSTEAAPQGERAQEEACLDAWLTKNKLDPYGSPEGTMYAGGTPLFDERTGETKDRLAFVYARHPDAKTACRSAAP